MLDQHDLDMMTKIICNAVEPLQKNFDGLQMNFDGLQKRFDGLQENVAGLQKNVGSLQKSVGGLQASVGSLQESVGDLQEDVKILKESHSRHERKVQSMQVYLETNITEGIQIIAEGHLDLARKFDQALIEARHDEMLKVRIWALTSDLQKLGDRLDELAG